MYFYKKKIQWIRKTISKLGFYLNLKKVNLESLGNFGSDLGQIWGGKVTYNYGNITIYLGIYTLCNPRNLAFLQQNLTGSIPVGDATFTNLTDLEVHMKPLNIRFKFNNLFLIC